MDRKYSDEARLTIKYSEFKELLMTAYKGGTARLACGDMDYFIENAIRSGMVESVRDDTVKIPDGKREMKLSELGLSVRAFNALVRALPHSAAGKDNRTVGEALLHIKNLAKVRNCGKACATNIINRFEAAGIPVPEWKEQTSKSYLRK